MEIIIIMIIEPNNTNKSKCIKIMDIIIVIIIIIDTGTNMGNIYHSLDMQVILYHLSNSSKIKIKIQIQTINTNKNKQTTPILINIYTNKQKNNNNNSNSLNIKNNKIDRKIYSNSIVNISRSNRHSILIIRNRRYIRNR